MASKTVVLAFFNDEPTADDAVEALKTWDKGDDLVKLDAIGVLALDDKGKIKTHKLGKRSVGKGAGIGLVLAVIAPPTLLAGVIGGGLLGAFHHKGLGLKAADRERIASQLSAGQAAVGVLVNPAIAIDVSAKLTELGGTAEVHEVTEEAVAEVETAVPAVEAAEIAAGDDLSILDGVGPKYADALKAGGVTTFAQLSRVDRRGHRSEAERGERAADRRPHRRHVAAAGDARIPPGLVGVAPLHRLHEDGGRRLDHRPDRRYPRRPRPFGSGALWFSLRPCTAGEERDGSERDTSLAPRPRGRPVDRHRRAAGHLPGRAHR